ncbi:hypothetical protein [Planomonospora sp. ID67723]|nr:hypothetical protein [Planomonospora sp. ID67723]
MDRGGIRSEDRLAALAARAGAVHAVRPGAADGGPAGQDLRAQA